LEVVMKKTKKPKKKTFFEKSTIGEFGNVLPIGIPEVANRSFSFKSRIMFGDRKMIADLRDQGLPIGKYVSSVLGLFVDRVGDTNIQGMEEEVERLLFFRSMYFADVLYMYYRLKIEKFGKTLAWIVNCPYHKFSFEYEADLGTADVQYIKREDGEIPKSISWDVPLIDGLEYKGELRKTLGISMPHWGIFHDDAFAEQINEAEAMSIMLQQCVLKADGNPIAVTDELLESGLTDVDYEHLSNFLSDRMGGPQLIVDVKCKRCKRSIFEVIKWMSPDFLSSSSSRAKTGII